MKSYHFYTVVRGDDYDAMIHILEELWTINGPLTFHEWPIDFPLIAFNGPLIFH